jgi:CheY-like chemotaxis protein
VTIQVRPPPTVLVLGTGALVLTPLPFPENPASAFTIVDERRSPDGVDVARALRPDVMLIDVGDDHGKGLDLCRALQAEPATRHIPLIAITGDPAIGQFMMTMSVKVCNVETLKDEINRLVS